MASLKETAQEWYSRYALPPWTIVDRLFTQESGWNHYSRPGVVLTSVSGALGVSQLMPTTAAGLNVNPKDPLDNLRGGLIYLSQMWSRFQGDVVKAVAAYNAGPGFVDSWDRTRAYLHNFKNRSGAYPYRQTEAYLDAILGPQWETIPKTGGGSTDTPGPGTWFPSLPSPEEIGEGIGAGIATRIKEYWAQPKEELIANVAPIGFTLAGIGLVFWGVVLGSGQAIGGIGRSAASKELDIAMMVPDPKIQMGARSIRRVTGA